MGSLFQRADEAINTVFLSSFLELDVACLDKALLLRKP